MREAALRQCGWNLGELWLLPFYVRHEWTAWAETMRLKHFVVAQIDPPKEIEQGQSAVQTRECLGCGLKQYRRDPI